MRVSGQVDAAGREALPGYYTDRPRPHQIFARPAKQAAMTDAQQTIPQSPAQDPAVETGRGPRIQYRVPWQVEWNRRDLPVGDLPRALEGFRVIHLTDLHLRRFWSEAYDRLIRRVNDAAADLILITGDFVNSKRNHVPEVPFARRFVSQLQARFGCFGILGNHDRYGLEPRMNGSGVMLLDGRRQVIEVNGAPLELIGLPGVDRRDVTGEVLERFPPREPGMPRLVLAHFPDLIRKARVLQPDIFFAGHTHGGQICLPGGIPIIRHDSLPPRLVRGIHRVDRTWLVVSRGLGFTGLPLRLFCPAEVIEITLVGG